MACVSASHISAQTAAATSERRSEFVTANRRVEHNVNGEVRVVDDVEQFLAGEERQRGSIAMIGGHDERVHPRGVARQIQRQESDRHCQQQLGDAELVVRRATPTHLFAHVAMQRKPIVALLHVWKDDVVTAGRPRCRNQRGDRLPLDPVFLFAFRGAQSLQLGG